jgi:hypothetical protein
MRAYVVQSAISLFNKLRGIAFTLPSSANTAAGLIIAGLRNPGRSRRFIVHPARSANTVPTAAHIKRAMKKISRMWLAIKPRARDILHSGLVPPSSAEVNRHKHVSD